MLDPGDNRVSRDEDTKEDRVFCEEDTFDSDRGPSEFFVDCVADAIFDETALSVLPAVLVFGLLLLVLQILFDSWTNPPSNLLGS